MSLTAWKKLMIFITIRLLHWQFEKVWKGSIAKDYEKKKRSLSQKFYEIRCESTKITKIQVDNTNFCLFFRGTFLAWGGTNFVWGAQAVIWGVTAPECFPVAPGLLFHMHALLESDYAIWTYILHFLLCAVAQRREAWHNTSTINTSLDAHFLMVTAY